MTAKPELRWCEICLIWHPACHCPRMSATCVLCTPRQPRGPAGFAVWLGRRS